MVLCSCQEKTVLFWNLLVSTSSEWFTGFSWWSLILFSHFWVPKHSWSSMLVSHSSGTCSGCLKAISQPLTFPYMILLCSLLMVFPLSPLCVWLSVIDQFGDVLTWPIAYQTPWCVGYYSTSCFSPMVFSGSKELLLLTFSIMGTFITLISPWVILLHSLTSLSDVQLGLLLFSLWDKLFSTVMRLAIIKSKWSKSRPNTEWFVKYRNKVTTITDSKSLASVAAVAAVVVAAAAVTPAWVAVELSHRQFLQQLSVIHYAI